MQPMRVCVRVLLAATVVCAAWTPLGQAHAAETHCNLGPCGTVASAPESDDLTIAAVAQTALVATGSSLTDPLAITPRAAYDFSEDLEFTSPARFPAGSFAGAGEVLAVGRTWQTWNPQLFGKHVVYAPSGTYTTQFTIPRQAVGVVAEPNLFGVFGITVTAYDAAHGVVGSTTRLIDGFQGATFLGVASTEPNISSITLVADPNALGFAFSDLTYARQIGNSLSGYAEVQNAADLNVTGDWTLEAWFKDEDPNGFNHDFHQILMKGDRDANADAPYYVLVGRNSILAGVRVGGQDYPIVSDLVYQGLDPKLWHHVAVTFNASINTLNLWLDGRHISYLQVPAHSSVGNSAPLEIGRNGPITGKYWVGKIDDVRIWSVTRKGDEISATYATELSGSQPGLVGNWRFDEISGATATDTSGRNHTATLNGAAAFSADIHP